MPGQQSLSWVFVVFCFSGPAVAVCGRDNSSTIEATKETGLGSESLEQFLPSKEQRLIQDGKYWKSRILLSDQTAVSMPWVEKEAGAIFWKLQSKLKVMENIEEIYTGE